MALSGINHENLSAQNDSSRCINEEAFQQASVPKAETSIDKAARQKKVLELVEK